jgi:hypothetical protein
MNNDGDKTKIVDFKRAAATKKKRKKSQRAFAGIFDDFVKSVESACEKQLRELHAKGKITDEQLEEGLRND